MFSHAAFASATRSLHRVHRVEQPGPDLPGPDRSCPFAFDGDSAGPNVPLGDLSVFDISAPSSLFPPAFGTPAAEQERFRQEVHTTLQSLSGSSAAPGAVRTYGATFRAIASQVTAKLSLRVLRMDSEGVFYALFTAVVLLGPKSPSPLSGQPAVRWNYVKLVTEAVAFWRVVRGMRAVFDAEWPPRTGAVWAGFRRPCIHASSEISPRLLAGMRAVCICGEAVLARVRQAVAGAELPAVGCDLKLFLEHAIAGRSAASTSIACGGRCFRPVRDMCGFVSRRRGYQGARPEERSGRRGPARSQCFAPHVGRRLSSPPVIGMDVVKKVARRSPRPRVSTCRCGRPHSVLCRVRPGAFRPLCGRLRRDTSAQSDLSISCLPRSTPFSLRLGCRRTDGLPSHFRAYFFLEYVSTSRAAGPQSCRGSSSRSSPRAFLVNFTRDFALRYFRIHGRALRFYPRRGNQGSGAPLFVASGSSVRDFCAPEVAPGIWN